jgi:hypothetical protein
MFIRNGFQFSQSGARSRGMFRKPMNKRGSEEYNRLFDVRFCPAINNATARGASTQVPDARIAEFQTRGAGGARKVTATIRNTNF